MLAVLRTHLPGVRDVFGPSKPHGTGACSRFLRIEDKNRAAGLL